ncbi:MAG: PSD1 and planctomycete cytochrome C domain-containing protein [Opitutaceae bacterium]
MPTLRPLLLLAALRGLPRAAPAADAPVSFNEQIRPLLAQNCLACHGPDAGHRKAGLRLDDPASATAERRGVRAIVPGDPEASELWQRVISPHADEVMPPPDAHKPPLSPEQRALLRRWIQEGAPYQAHWAFLPVTRPALPPVAGGAAEHPVDRFIGARLAARGWSLAAEAPRETLIRRLSLDLTGLPPTPAEVDAFLADLAPGAYERVVDRLLHSPRYGENLARPWLDAVRYADTHGLHLDNVRTIWPYRDWVVSAFNRNLPFDRFTLEQLAGDLLPSPTIDQLVASGYNRNHLSTSEGGSIEAEAEARNTADRVDTTAAVFLGLTASCASCHDHKFDPLSQKEYYALGAFFKGLADRCWDGNVRISAPIVVIAPDDATQRRIAELDALAGPLEAAVSARAAALADDGLDANPGPRGQSRDRKTTGPVTYEVVWAEDSDLPTPATVLAPPPAGEWQEGKGVPLAGGRRALRLEGDVDRPVLFTAGDVNLVVRTAATAYVHLHPDPARPPRAVSIEFLSEEGTRRMIWGDPQAFGSEIARAALHAGPLPPAGQYTRLELSACDSEVREGRPYTGIRIAQRGGAAWWDRAGAVLTSPAAAQDPLLSKDAWVSGLRTGARAFSTLSLRHDINFLVGLSGTQQVGEEKERIARFHRDFIYGPLRGELEPEAHAARRVMAEQVAYEQRFPLSPISRELAEPRPAHVLKRGQYDQPGELVAPATPSFLPPLVARGARPDRLDFARWLVDARQPLTSRVTVNRFWGQLFGAGLVRTPADFGLQGEPPTHPELLDWLAAEFQAGGWDVKALVRLLVTSRTYRQDARVASAQLEGDPENRLLGRGPRLRLDAEVLRDQALALGGLLRPELGGPPVRPYQPVNIWEPVAFGGSNTKVYVQDQGAALYRRSLYTFWKRTAPAPAMSTFDAPARETFCVARPRSNTPLQALALMNDVQQFEAARGFAERLLRPARPEPERLTEAFRQATARFPTPAESTLLARNLARHREHFARHPEAAREVLRNGESSPAAGLEPGEFAAWTMVANLLLNLDEVINRN